MSFFQTDAVLIDEHPRETVNNGVLLERRSLLRISTATAAAAMATMATSCFAPSRKLAKDTGKLGSSRLPAGDGTLDLSEFLIEMHPRAQGFIASGGKREEAYLMAVGELMTRLQPTNPMETQAEMMRFLKGKEGQAVELVVVMFALEPGKGFSHHDHRDYNGVILGVEGEAHVTNYDILGDTLVPPKDETFQIRQTRDDLILPGRFSSLGTTRENVHELKAGPTGATVLDVFTFLKPGAQSYYMDVDPTPRNAKQRIYDAVWS